MPKHGKRYRSALETLDSARRYGLAEAVETIAALPSAKFDETLELHVRLGVDPTHQEQQVRGTVTLPHGTGKTVRVIAFASGDSAAAAREAGADEVGTEELAQRIQLGWLEFDAAVATPDNMRIIGPLGRILGPRGLMPNARAGTVTRDIGRVIGELKAGRVQFRFDRQGIIHAPFGKLSLGRNGLVENLASVVDAIVRARPAAAKGTYLRSMAIAATMGPSVRLDPVAAQEEASRAAA